MKVSRSFVWGAIGFFCICGIAYISFVLGTRSLNTDSTRQKSNGLTSPQTPRPSDLSEMEINEKNAFAEETLSECNDTPDLNMDLPFQPKPDCFMSYLNNDVMWKKGVSYEFSELSQCSIQRNIGLGHTPEQNKQVTGYLCSSGFVAITDPRGTQVCELDSDFDRASGYPIGVIYRIRDNYTTFYKKNCVWRVS